MLALIAHAIVDFIFGTLLGTRLGQVVVFAGAAAGLVLVLWLAFDAI